MRFRPCIDLHNGKVKQIVGSTLKDDRPELLKENFVTDLPPSYFAYLYKRDGFRDGHVIMLGKGNEEAALDALKAWPNAFQIGGGITPENAEYWLKNGASAVIVTSYILTDNDINWDNLKTLEKIVSRERLVIDLSCKKTENGYMVCKNKWQITTNVQINESLLKKLSEYCFEFLIHAIDVEGACKGVDVNLIELLKNASPIKVTYAGGIKDLSDIEKIYEAGEGKIDFTVGSALDIFGGSGIKYDELVKYLRSIAQK